MLIILKFLVLLVITYLTQGHTANCCSVIPKYNQLHLKPTSVQLRIEDPSTYPAGATT